MIDAPIAFAAPDQTFRNPARRSVTYRWMRPDVTPWEDGMTRVVELHVSHDASRKCIDAALSLSEVGGGIQSTQIRRGAYLTIHRTLLARYSARALEKAADDALRTLNLGQQDPRVQALMSGELFA